MSDAPLPPKEASWLRRWVTPTVIGVVFLGTAYFLGWFGWEGVWHALSYGGRIAGALLLLVAIFLVAAVSSAYDHWRVVRTRRAEECRFKYSGSVVLLAAVAAFVANCFLFIMAASDRYWSSSFWIWVALAALSLWVAVRVYRTPVVFPAAPKKFAVAAVVAAVAAVANFGYVHIYQPFVEPMKVLIMATLGDPLPGPNGENEVSFPLSLTVKNPGNVTVYFLGGTYTVLGRNTRMRPTAEGKEWQDSLTNSVPRGLTASPGTLDNEYELVQAHRWIQFGSWLAGGDEMSLNKTVKLTAPASYDDLVVHAQAVIVRHDRLRFRLRSGVAQHEMEETSLIGNASRRLPSWSGKVPEGFEYMKWTTGVIEDNAISKHTRRPRNIVAWWLLPKATKNHNLDDITAKMIATIAPPGMEERAPDQHELLERYGLTVVGAGYSEKSLWGLNLSTPR